MRGFQSFLISSYLTSLAGLIILNVQNNTTITVVICAFLDAVSLFCLGHHLMTEGWIYHLIPAYVTTVLCSTSIICIGTISELVLIPNILFAISVFLSAISTLFVLLLPIPTLPLPKGPYKVGSTIIQLKEHEITFKLFYPTDANHGVVSPYLLLTGNKIFAEESHYENRLWGNKFWAHHVVFRTSTHSLLNAPVSEHDLKIPVVLYSCGQQATVEENTHLCENLASYYFVVCALYHHDELPNQSPVDRRLQAIEEALKFLTEANESGEFDIRTVIPAQVQLKAPEDVSSIQFRGRLDLEKGVGIFGQSFGGSTALMACCSSTLESLPEFSPPIVCGAALDCWMHPLRINYLTIQKPFLFLSGDLFMKHQAHNFKELCDNHLSEEVKAHVGIFKSTPHQNFTEFPILFNTAWNSNPILSTKFFTGEDGGMDWGKADGRMILDVLGNLLVEYFLHHLEKNNSTEFNEAVMKHHNRGNMYKYQLLSYHHKLKDSIVKEES